MSDSKEFNKIPFKLPEWFSLSVYNRHRNMSIEEWDKELWARRYFIHDLNFDIEEWILKIKGCPSGYSGEYKSDSMQEEQNDALAQAEKMKGVILNKKDGELYSSAREFQKEHPAIRSANIKDVFGIYNALCNYDDVREVFDGYQLIEPYTDRGPLALDLSAFNEVTKKPELNIVDQAIKELRFSQSNERKTDTHIQRESTEIKDMLKTPLSKALRMDSVDLISVNLNSPDDAIIKGFTEWLKTKRENVTKEKHKAYVKNHKRDSGASLEKTHNESHISYWHKNKVLAYIDLKIIMRHYGLIQIKKLYYEYRDGSIEYTGAIESNKKILANIEKQNHSFYASILFPTDLSYGTGDKDTVRREIAPLADMLLYGHMGLALSRPQT